VYLVRGTLLHWIACNLCLELSPNDLYKPSRPGGTDPHPYAQCVRGDWFLMSGAVSDVLLPRLFQEHLRRPPARCRRVAPWRFCRCPDLRLTWFISVPRPRACRHLCLPTAEQLRAPGFGYRRADCLQEAGAHFGPTDQEQRSNRVERRLSVLAPDSVVASSLTPPKLAARTRSQYAPLPSRQRLQCPQA
jgi:hypothetical protein